MVAGALTTAAAQLALGWCLGGTSTMLRYTSVLWKLALNPTLVQLYPTEVHSLRGVFQICTSSSRTLTFLSAASFMVTSAAALRTWTSSAPVSVRWSQLTVLTVLVSPHLLTYDLLLLSLMIVVLAAWTLQNPEHALQPFIKILLVAAYFAPFSSNLARLVGVQLSTIVMASLAVCVHLVCTKPHAFRARVHE